jgi:hypothetical protein
VKKWRIGLIVVVLVMCSSWNIHAAPGHSPGDGGNSPGIGERQDGPQGGPQGAPGEHQRQQQRNDARYIIHRTATVIFEAQRAVERGHQFLGMARAIAAQQRARDLYLKGNYRDSIFHSLRARKLAIQIIRGNRGKIRPEFFPDKLESRYEHEGPGDDQLDRQMDQRRMGRDDDAARIRIELDID